MNFGLQIAGGDLGSEFGPVANGLEHYPKRACQRTQFVAGVQTHFGRSIAQCQLFGGLLHGGQRSGDPAHQHPAEPNGQHYAQAEKEQDLIVPRRSSGFVVLFLISGQLTVQLDQRAQRIAGAYLLFLHFALHGRFGAD